MLTTENELIELENGLVDLIEDLEVSLKPFDDKVLLGIQDYADLQRHGETLQEWFKARRQLDAVQSMLSDKIAGVDA